jgi:hypothetical protein
VSLSREARALLERRSIVAPRRGDRIPASPDSDSAPLSFGQELIWLTTQLDKTTAAYNRCSQCTSRGL